MNKLLLTFLFLGLLNLFAADKEECMECHSDPDLETEMGGKTVSLFIDGEIFDKSVHGEIECIDCHEDADVDDFPHEENLNPVYCGNCHDNMQLDYDAGIHGILELYGLARRWRRPPYYSLDDAEMASLAEFLEGKGLL